MKRIAIGLAAVLSVQAAAAQQTEGKVIYERTMELQIRLAGMPEEMQRQIPRTRTDKIEVSFANNQSLRKQLPQEESDEQVFNNTVDGGGQARGGVRISVMGAGADDVTFTDLAKGTIADQRELGTKKYVVSDSVTKLNWKLTGETRTILGYPCQQATAQRIGVRMQANMVNGQMKREEIADTANITAWFTPAIPAAAGPEFQGQLPGLILAIDINNGRTVYKALDVSPKVDVAVIKEPKGGKKITQQEFREEQTKLMQEMQRNNGGRATFRMSN